MSMNDRSGPSERPEGKNPAKRQGNTDLRIRRTRARLGAALRRLTYPFRISGNSMPAPTLWPGTCCHF